jgi:hypothetical protein
MRLLTTICTAVLLTVGVAPGAAAAPAPAPAEVCTRAEALLTGPDNGPTLWRYTHFVDYCTEGAKITSVGQPDADVQFVNTTCTFDGIEDRDRGTPGGETVRTFTMGLITCDPPNAEPYQVNPWVILTVHANGKHSSSMGNAPH